MQTYIGLFAGNSSQVTIAGESAGGGSVMLQDMAYGGSLGDQLFTNTIAASPYLPMQYGYKVSDTNLAPVQPLINLRTGCHHSLTTPLRSKPDAQTRMRTATHLKLSFSVSWEKIQQPLSTQAQLLARVEPTVLGAFCQ